MSLKLNLKNLNPSTKFYFDEDDKDGAFIELRVCAGKDIEAINKKTVKKKVEFKKGQRFEYNDINEIKRNELLWDFMITNWGNIVDEDDNEIECTLENKYLIMSESISFATFVAECLEKLNESATDYKENLEKN